MFANSVGGDAIIWNIMVLTLFLPSLISIVPFSLLYEPHFQHFHLPPPPFKVIFSSAPDLPLGRTPTGGLAMHLLKVYYKP